MTAATVAQNKAREDRIKVDREEAEKLAQQAEEAPMGFVSEKKTITKMAKKKVSKKK